MELSCIFTSVITTKTTTMKFSTTFQASELRADLKAVGVKVLRCKQYHGNALVTIANTPENMEAFESFARENNYGSTCGKAVFAQSKTEKYIDYGNVFKYREAQYA